jgi:hypothetical protein
MEIKHLPTHQDTALTIMYITYDERKVMTNFVL